VRELRSKAGAGERLQCLRQQLWQLLLVSVSESTCSQCGSILQYQAHAIPEKMRHGTAISCPDSLSLSSICCFFDDDLSKEIFHCVGCGICRLSNFSTQHTCRHIFKHIFLPRALSPYDRIRVNVLGVLFLWQSWRRKQFLPLRLLWMLLCFAAQGQPQMYCGGHASQLPSLSRGKNPNAALYVQRIARYRSLIASKSPRFMLNHLSRLQDLFHSTSQVRVLRCGHTLHKKCLDQLLRRPTALHICPLCSKTLNDHSFTWHQLDVAVSQTPMPEEYLNTTVPILCNDCHTQVLTFNPKAKSKYALDMYPSNYETLKHF
jgi:hypothetical protein